MMEKNPQIAPVVVTYNTFLHCAFRSNNYGLAKHVFCQMKEKDIFTYSINNLYLLKKGLIKEAIQSYEELKKTDHYIDQVFYNILINGLMKQKQFKLAY